MAQSPNPGTPQEIPSTEPPLGIPPMTPDRAPPGVNEPIGVPDNTPQEMPSDPGSPAGPEIPSTPQPRA
jgi:hypothetical protein